ncbi:unnamed protein product [Sphacelaria rigidula]
MMAPFLRRGGVGSVYELKYAFLYAYNGTTFAVPGTTVGAHTGDLEHVTVRVDALSMTVLEVFFAAHSTGEGKWIPSEAFYRQARLTQTLSDVLELEAKIHPGVAPEVPASQREFLELENDPQTKDPLARAGSVEKNSELSVGQNDREAGVIGTGASRVGTRAVVYPARDGHASYHMAKRWRRFGGLGDDICNGDGKVWQPLPVVLDHPKGSMPAWLRFRGKYGAPGCITSEAFWRFQGEPLRRNSAEPKYRSLIEEGLVPDRGVRLGAMRRMLHGHVDAGIWLVRHRQQEQRVPVLDKWTRVPGLGAGRPNNAKPPPAPGLVWLHDWDFVKDGEGGSTDKHGWSYHHLSEGYADTGRSGKPKESGLGIHRGRSRIWFRAAGAPCVAREIEVRCCKVSENQGAAHREGEGQYPKPLLAVAALDLASHGETITATSVTALLSDTRQNHASNASGGSGAAKHKRGVGNAGDVEANMVSSSKKTPPSFAHVARRSLGSL